VLVGAVAEEIARLGKENATLRDRLFTTASTTFSGLTFDEMHRALLDAVISQKSVDEGDISLVQECVLLFEDSRLSLLHVFWAFGDSLAKGVEMKINSRPGTISIFDRLRTFGLIDATPVFEPTLQSTYITSVPAKLIGFIYRLTEDGRRFLLRLTVVGPGKELAYRKPRR
jgi:hypothetical protein